MTVQDIIREYLLANEYDGLYEGDVDGEVCCCGLDNICQWCLGTSTDVLYCEPGYIQPTPSDRCRHGQIGRDRWRSLDGASTRLRESEVAGMIIPKTVMQDIEKERARQYMKWGEQNHDDLYWNGILVEEAGEVSKAIIERQELRAIRQEIVHVAAVTVAWLEAIDRRNHD